MEVARLARRGYGLIDVALPVVQRLAGDVGETTMLTRRIDDVVPCVERC